MSRNPKKDHELIAEVLGSLNDMGGVSIQKFDTKGRRDNWTILDVSVFIAPKSESRENE